MIKILGAAAVVTASVAFGMVMARELGERVKLLNEIKTAAIYIKSDMEYRLPVFEDCFRGRGRFFSEAAKLIEGGKTPCEAVIEASERQARLSDKDRKILTSYAEGLEAEEIGGQMTNISLLITRLEADIKEAEEENAVKCRLYRSGGVLAGLAFVIVMI